MLKFKIIRKHYISNENLEEKKTSEENEKKKKMSTECARSFIFTLKSIYDI